jgi:hypothetical protein
MPHTQVEVFTMYIVGSRNYFKEDENKKQKWINERKLETSGKLSFVFRGWPKNRENFENLKKGL